jgi:hypothetical protein
MYPNTASIGRRDDNSQPLHLARGLLTRKKVYTILDPNCIFSIIYDLGVQAQGIQTRHLRSAEHRDDDNQLLHLARGKKV